MKTIDIVPVPKPRMTRSDKWKKRDCVVRYRAFCDELRLKLKELPEDLDIVFYLPMPNTWSIKKKKEMAGQPHKQKPDIDNLLKAILDAMLDDDSGIWKVKAEKRWARSGQIVFKSGAQDGT